MGIEPEETMTAEVRATLLEASARADDAWASIQEQGSSFGDHPLSDLLEGTTVNRSEVA